MKPKFAIAGLGLITGPNATYEPGRTARAMEAEAARLAIEDAGLKREDVDGFVHVFGGPRSGRAGMEYTDAAPRVLGLPVKFYYRCGRGGSWGTFGLTTAMSFLELGIAKYIVIAGSRDDWSRLQGSKQRGFFGQSSETRPAGTFADPLGGTTAVTMHTFFAARHMAVYGTKSEHFGALAVQIRQWANKNPLARMYNKPMSLEDHQNSPVHIWPYHVADMCVTSDGAVAFVLTTVERARDLKKKPVNVMGVGFGDAGGGQWWEGPEHYQKLPVKDAKAAAFAQAEIDLKDVSMVQFYDCFTGEVMFQLEDYGFCPKGEGGRYAMEYHNGPGGDLPMNTSGGLLSAYHHADLTGISESIIQLRGEAGDRQVPNAKVSLATGHGGELMSPGMCSIHSTLLLGVD